MRTRPRISWQTSCRTRPQMYLMNQSGCEERFSLAQRGKPRRSAAFKFWSPAHDRPVCSQACLVRAPSCPAEIVSSILVNRSGQRQNPPRPPDGNGAGKNAIRESVNNVRLHFGCHPGTCRTHSSFMQTDSEISCGTGRVSRARMQLHCRGAATGKHYRQPSMGTLVLFILSKRAAPLLLVMCSAAIPQAATQLEVKGLFLSSPVTNRSLAT